MAISAEEIIIDLQINDEGSTKTLNELEQRLENLKDALKNTAVGSEGFKKLKNEVIKADTQVKNLNKSIEGLDTEAMAGEIGKFGGGLTAAFTGVAALVGNSNEEFEKFTKNIVTGIALTQGIKGATEAWTAGTKLMVPVQRALNAAMKANPIGLIITAVAALTAGIYLLTRAMKDNRTAQQKNIELLKLNTEAYKAFISSVDNATKSLTAQEIAYFEAIESAEAMELKINQITEAERQQVRELEKNTKARKKELKKQLADISQFKRLNDPQAAFDEQNKINAQIRKEDNKFAKAKEALAKTTALKLDVIQTQLNKKLKDSDDDRFKSYVSLQDAIVKLIRDANNRILTIELDTYKILNTERTGLADFEIELLERNAAISKKILNEQNADTIESLEKQLTDWKFWSKEQKRLIEENAIVNLQVVSDNHDSELTSLINLAKLKKLSNEDYNKRSKELFNKTAAANAKVEEQLAADLKEIDNQKVIDKVGINAKIVDLEKVLAEEIIKIDENVAVQKLDVQKKFNSLIEAENLAAENRLKQGRLDIIDTVIQEQENIYGIEAALASEHFETIIDLEEALAQQRVKSAKDASIRQLSAIISRFELIKEKSAEELKLLAKLYQERAQLIVNAEEERAAIEQRFAEKRIQLEKDILKAQINGVQVNIDKELALREGNNERIAELTKRRIAGEKELELLALEERYKVDLQLAIGNAEKQQEITQTYEEAKKLTEDEFRNKKIEADLAGYLEVAKLGEQIFGDLQQILTNMNTARIDEELATQLDAFDAEASALDGLVDAGIETEESKADKLAAIEVKRAKAEKQAAYDKAKREKEAALLKVVIETALAVVEAAPIVPLQITAGILGATQAAVIASTPLPQLRRGGKILNGPKHEAGGIPLYKNGSQIAEVEGGETIMTAGVANSPVLLSAASAINQLAGGVAFTEQNFTPSAASNTGGSAQNNIGAIVRETVKGISSIPVINVATKTTKVDRTVKNIEAKSKF